MYLKGHNDTQVGRFLIEKKRILIPVALGLLVIGIFAAGIMGGFMLQKRYNTPKESARQIWCNKMRTVSNVVMGQDPFPSGIKTFHLDIGHTEYQRLAFKRQEALKHQVMLSSEDDYVPAQATLDGVTKKIKVRLKGNLADHFGGDRWSLRVVVKNDQTLKGMRRFSLNLPPTRNFLYEWIILQMLKQEGLITIRYEFVRVVMNGKDMGIYALEEHFDKRLLENNNRREGPILKYDETDWWQERIGYDERELPGVANYQQADIDVFNRETTLADTALARQYRAGTTLLDGFRRGLLPASQVFDIQQMATFVAICDLFGTDHPLHTNQLRFYFNPLTAKLEPIPFDLNAGYKTNILSGTKTLADDYEWEGGGISDWMAPLFRDPEVFAVYAKALRKVSKPKYLKDFLQKNDSLLTQNQAILHAEYPCWDFHSDRLRYNQIYIRKALRPLKGVNAFFVKKENQKIHLDAGNIQRLPMEVLGIKWRDSIFIPVDSAFILNPQHPKRRVVFQRLSFTLPNALAGSWPYPDTVPGAYRLVHSIPGLWDSLSSVIQPWPYFDKKSIPVSPRIHDHPFWDFNAKKKTVRFKPGKWVLSNTLVIPTDVTLFAGEGVELDLQHGASIICHGKIKFTGSDTYPIRIVSTDSTGGGVLVLGKGKSHFKWVNFNNLNIPKDGGRQLTGAVTVYGSNIAFANCKFEHSRCEDALNLVRSEVWLKQCFFAATYGDALDLDFCHGKLLNSKFVNAGNDAIDASGSQLVLNDIHIEQAGDKGISAGEKSFLEGNRIEILGGQIGMASKDLSEVRLNQVRLSGCNMGLVAFQKKSEFGGAKLLIEKGEIEGVERQFMPEKKSAIWFNGQHIRSEYEAVADSLYGE